MLAVIADRVSLIDGEQEEAVWFTAGGLGGSGRAPPV
jgi:hypothetical protein